MERLLALHARLQFTILLVLIGLLLWGLLCALRARLGQAYLATLAIAQLLLVAEGLLGVLLLFGTNAPGRLVLHIVYGTVALLLLPAVYLYNRGRSHRWQALAYAATALFLAGVTMRAAIVAG